MTNIFDILKGIGMDIPEEKKTEFNKAFAENYKTIVEHSKLQDKLNAATKRAETAEEALKGFDGIDPANIRDQLEEANRKVREAQEAAQKQIDERDFDDALKTELDALKFSSNAARKSVEAEIRSAGLKLKNGKILGLSDMITQLQTSDADAFVLDNGKPAPHFTSPSKGGASGGGTTLTKKEIMAIKDDNERYQMIEQNKDLFLKKG